MISDIIDINDGGCGSGQEEAWFPRDTPLAIMEDFPYLPRVEVEGPYL